MLEGKEENSEAAADPGGIPGNKKRQRPGQRCPGLHLSPPGSSLSMEPHLSLTSLTGAALTPPHAHGTVLFSSAHRPEAVRAGRNLDAGSCHAFSLQGKRLSPERVSVLLKVTQ